MRTGVNAPALLVDKYINSAYDTVKVVADNIGDVNIVADLAEVPESALYVVADLDTEIRAIADNPEGFVWVTNNTNKIDRLHTSVTQIDRVYTSIDKVDDVADSIVAVDYVYDNIQPILGFQEDLQTEGFTGFVDFVETKVNDAINAQALDAYVAGSNIIQQRFVTTTATNIIPSAHAIDNNVCNVYVNGVYQDKSTYAVDITGFNIVFVDDLSIGSVVNIHSSDVSLSVDPEAFVLDLIKAVPTLYSKTVTEWIAAGNYTGGTNTLDLSTILPFVIGESSLYSSISVFVNGVFQAPLHGYSIGGTYGNNLIIFTETLPVDTVLSFIIGYVLPVPTISTTLSKASGSWIVGTSVGITVGTGKTTVDTSSQGISYIPAERQLQVFVNGLYQSIAAITYVEASATSIEINSELIAGDVVDIFKIV